MTSVEPLSGLPVLLVNPNVSVPTAAVFAAWDGIDHGPLIDWRSGRNDLERAAKTVAHEIGTTLDSLFRLAGNARMSGSGATCFAVFDDIGARDATAERVAKEEPAWWQLQSVLR